MGGGWRQAGYLAAAGIYALDNHVERLKEDHKRAQLLGAILSQKSYINKVYPIQTNIVIVELLENILATEMVSKLAEQNIYCSPFGKHLVRFVTHLDFNDSGLDSFESSIKKLSFS